MSLYCVAWPSLYNPLISQAFSKSTICPWLCLTISLSLAVSVPRLHSPCTINWIISASHNTVDRVTEALPVLQYSDSTEVPVFLFQLLVTFVCFLLGYLLAFRASSHRSLLCYLFLMPYLVVFFLQEVTVYSERRTSV